MCCVGPLEVAQYPLDLALLGQGNSQIEMESDDVAIEIGGGQQAAELIHVTAPHVDPPPEGDRLGIDARAQSAPKQSDERDAAGGGIVKARGFRSAWIYRRHREVLSNVTERMRIAYCEIVQSALHTCIPANRKV